MTKYDVERGLREIAKARQTERSDFVLAETAKLAGLVADGFRREFDDELDMETVGKVLVIAATSLPPLVAGETGIPGAVVMNLIAFAGEELVRTARARAAESVEVAGETDFFVGETGPALLEFVLTWHPVTADPVEPIEVPLNKHVAWCPEELGEFQVSTREIRPGCGHDPDRVENDEVVADEHTRQCGGGVL